MCGCGFRIAGGCVIQKCVGSPNLELEVICDAALEWGACQNGVAV